MSANSQREDSEETSPQNILNFLFLEMQDASPYTEWSWKLDWAKAMKKGQTHRNSYRKAGIEWAMLGGMLCPLMEGTKCPEAQPIYFIHLKGGDRFVSYN